MEDLERGNPAAQLQMNMESLPTIPFFSNSTHLGPSFQLLLSCQFELRCFGIVHAAPRKLLRG